MLVTNSLTGGGAERAMNLLSIELLNRGWSTALVPINAGGQDQVIPLCDVFPLERPWNGSLASTFKSVIKFNQVVRSWRPDVVILNCDLPELLGALLFVKWVFYAPDIEDDEFVVNIKQHKNVQAKTLPLKSPTIDTDFRQYKYAQTTPSELIQLKQNREKLKILDDKILYAKRKIDIMKDNGVIGAIIDDIAGNSIADEQAKIIELEKQKKSITN